ncbi:MAG: 3-oxoacyl-ACP reductase FabG [Chloroflexi bacterium]|nr:3-oxoacyl-ACP reductase FabG [Chloroflexota bacterium]
MSSPLFSLEGKIAIVTGGGRGIGKAIALGFVQCGADVVVCSRTPAELEEVAGEVRRLGRRSLAVKADITSRADIENLARETVSEFGRIDILVNNAGSNIRGQLLKLREEDWDLTLNTDLKGYFLCCQVVGDRMVAQRSGNIINIGSDLIRKATPTMGVYSIAKAGVDMMTRILAVELARFNIRVNAINPSLLRTKFSDFAWRDPESERKFAAERPMGRIGEPEDVVGAAIFLASDASRYITGHSILIDGGMHA